MSRNSGQNVNSIFLTSLCWFSIFWALEILRTQHVFAKQAKRPNQPKKTKIEKDLEFQKAFKKSKLVPDVINSVPWDELEVEYNNGTVDLGNTLVIHQVWRQPSDVYWPKQVGAFYTLLFLAPDHPDASNPRLKEYVLWSVVNIRDRNIKQGEVIAEYIMPPPPEKCGRQRYVFLLFQQKPTGNQKIEEEYIPPIPEDQARANFSTRQFIKKYNFPDTPSAGNFFYIDWGVCT